jgi:hypothetical protein
MQRRLTAHSSNGSPCITSNKNLWHRTTYILAKRYNTMYFFQNALITWHTNKFISIFLK